MSRRSARWIARWRAAIGSARPRVLGAVIGLLAAIGLAFGLSGGMRLTTLTLCVCVLGGLWVTARYALAPRTARERSLLRVPLALLFIGTVASHYGQACWEMYSARLLRTWNVYHYYLGSKYFEELGYTGLYAQTLVADREQGQRLAGVERVRDMVDYRVKPVANVVPDRRAPAFSDERWRAFKRDLDVLVPQEPRELWESILTDRGYNPTPCWNALVSALSRRIDIAHHAELMVGTSIDVVLYLAMLGAIGWAFGIDAALVSMLCFMVLPFNLTRLIGGYIQYDWLAAITLGLCFVRKRWPIAAGLALGYATMTRVFPLLLVAALALPALRRLLGERRLDRFTRRFAVALVLTCALGGALGATSTKGMGSWTEWGSKILTHNSGMTFGMGRVGLRHIFTHELGRAFERTEEARQATYTEHKTGYAALAAVLLGLFAATAWRRCQPNALLLGMLLVYLLVVPSHYYWSMLALLPLWRVSADEPWSPALLPALAAFVIPAGWYLYARVESFQYAQYLCFDWLLGAAWLGICGWLVQTDWRRSRRAPR